MVYFIPVHHLLLLDFSGPAIGRFALGDTALLPTLTGLADTWSEISPKLAVASLPTVNRVRR